MRKILISLCLILVTTLSIACCKSEKINDDNLILISNIEIFDSPQEIVKCLSDMESELNNFISQNKGIKEKWYLDVTNLGLEDLITLRKELEGSSVSCLDAVIYDRTCTSTFMHQMNNERKETGKRNYKKKMKRRN